MKVTEYKSDGTVVHSEWEEPPELKQLLENAQAEWKRLADAGTPYWCIHKRSVTHPAAYWRDDDYNDPVHRKHGVFCADCGGYIQEG